MKHVRILVFLTVAVVALLGLMRVQVARGQQISRDQAATQMKNGNWKEAYDGFSAAALDAQDDPNKVGDDLINAIQCLSRLGRDDEIDAFREKVIAAHPQEWRLLYAAARSYSTVEHGGFLIAGEFSRGGHRGGGKYVNAHERDRVRALQLMVQALPSVKAEPNGKDAGDFYWNLSAMLLGDRGWGESWRLQELTDLTTLPDYEEGYRGRYFYGIRYAEDMRVSYGSFYTYRGYSSSRGAPVNADGTPVFYALPKSWDAARNDGERWRWTLQQAMTADPALTAQVKMTFANFLLGQFGVQSMAGYTHRQSDDDGIRKDETGPYALVTLKETETIAKLANGIKRLTLPDEFNYIKLYQQVAEMPDDPAVHFPTQALRQLGQIFEDRRQYDRAVDYWKRAGDTERVNQILGNWGQFDPVMTQPAGQGATVNFRFRNGNKVHFTAREINTQKLLADVEAYYKSNPQQYDWQMMDINNVGWRIVEKNQTQYLTDAAPVEWDRDLQPRDGHFDRLVTVATPLKTAGAYLLTSTMAGGNTCRIVIWVADTAIVKKQLSGQTMYYVADAVTGKPLPKTPLQMFGYRQDWGNGRASFTTAECAKVTDDDGIAFTTNADQSQNYTWVTTATANGRLAFLGFSGVWYGERYDAQYTADRTFVITDRPVYRPSQAVKFKFWVNHAQYDQDGKSPFAGKQFTVKINNPKGEKVYEQAMTADDFGGFNGEFPVPQDATLGVYSLYIDGLGGSSFRVEEYKKPEFEVTVDAPKDPVMLGDTVTATVNAKYYFGAPVTNAKVHYKVLRSSFSASWYPTARWDWFYGPGYWWYAPDYVWYPGWRDWGCMRPRFAWWGYAPQPQPEVVLEGDDPIGEDGTLPIQIDTSLAKAIFGDTDHRYQITAEVTDQSRRTIVGNGAVLVARKPFKVYAWVDRGHYRVGDTIKADFTAQTLDNKPVKGHGNLRLLRVSYQTDGAGELKPVETEVGQWNVDTNAQGTAHQQMKAGQAGQYRLSYAVTDGLGRRIEGGYVFVVRGDGFNGDGFRFNDLELITDKQEYQPGESVNLMINTNREDATVLLFLRPTDGVCQPPQVLRLNGKSVNEVLAVAKKDMPNFFVEALTVSNGKVHTEVREVEVPPEQRILNVAVEPSAEKYQPGQPATVKVKVSDLDGKPYTGSLVVSMYDKSVEYISGGSNVPDIKEFFWKWRRNHNSRTESSLDKGGYIVYKTGEPGMAMLGAFGASVVDEENVHAFRFGANYAFDDADGARLERARGAAGLPAVPALAAAPAPMEASLDKAANGAMAMDAFGAKDEMKRHAGAPGEGGGMEDLQPTVRSNFADTALWVGALQTDANGEATVKLTMPENLTTWKTRVWAMGNGTKVGEGEADVLTSKNLILRMQTPRFFTQKDEVVLSANVHNYLATKKNVKVALELDGACVQPINEKTNTLLPPDANGNFQSLKTVTIPAGGELRVDWRVKVVEPGQATVRMKAITNEESDAMQMSFPVYVHGGMKTESFSGVIRPDGTQGAVTFTVPQERLPWLSRLEVRYSPTLAGAMVDALPYMTAYPYDTTDVTIDRFLPTVMTQKILLQMGLDLKAIAAKQTNLNAQEIGDDKTRAKDWQRMNMPGDPRTVRNPVFDQAEVTKMVTAGLQRLANMQNSDGGWGWWSGYGEYSTPHSTAYVVHGLQLARSAGVAVPPDMIARGCAWLKSYQAQQISWLQEWDRTKVQGKSQADALDAFVYMVLVDEKAENGTMRDYLYRDRIDLPVYAKCMFGIALNAIGDTAKRDMLIRNIDQFLVQDDENQTAYLKLPENNWWWCWYGSEYEAQAYYLKLLTVVDPAGVKASRLVKYLLNNRKHATYWNSTRDTAIVIEAMADYMHASGEDKPNLTVSVLLDGQKIKDVPITADTLFTFDNKLVMEGEALTPGAHTVTLVKQGTGPLYYNAYVTNFTLEDNITRAGLEIKVNRKYYRLQPVQASKTVEGQHGQSVATRVEKYTRVPLDNLATLKSGDLVEVELTIDSKNDYEYILFEDIKAAGFEPTSLQSGYGGNEMGAYMELHDDRVAFFVRSLARGKHSLSYRLRAETPGEFSALPTKASAMYAPELKANSDEIKLRIED